ncbi:hypothetical protein KUL25_04220 [Rhodobacteraceae bacterium N5(2021)]|uniref:Uncharacterized protein n=1 Tax=Gymnodinialimonas phycosphaerae TaxID=2841589 RepID=A0A975YGQ4_9RHOB|nr:hypothetical protein [Gymnodinialimonas phycosphaerae]MBY4891967.1 hypothetical protein [Gymnodinialimonas phycosphaerae]
MTHVQTVRDTLLATAQTGSLLNARLMPSDPDDALRQVATSIDRTSLECRLQFTLSDKTEIALDARNRRLLQFSATSKDIHGVAAPTTRCISENGTEIAQQLRAILDGKTIIRQRFIDDPAIEFPATSGVSAALILQCLDHDPRPPAMVNLETVLTGLVATTPAKILGACVLTSEDIFVIDGSDEQVLAMVDLAKPVLGVAGTAASDRSCKFQTGGVCALNWGGPNPRQLLIANAAHQVGLVLVETDHGSDLLTELRSQLHRP